MVYEAAIDGAINPATADYVHRSLLRAVEDGAECLVLRLNTPGGLLKSTRVIVSEFLSADIPVIVYVSPSGAQAASAGVFITMAGHVAAMAPGTNIGAAHPVALQGEQDSVMMEKATNDAAAFIRTIAENRHRNLEWAEEAVRKSLSITEKEALSKNVVDLIAKDLPELLEKIDGRTVSLPSSEKVLQTKGARVESLTMEWSERILDILSDPNIAYILFMLGVYGLLFELYNPGSILPGVVGVISLILAFYSLHTLPVNYAGLALILFAIILFLAEIKVTSYGMLSVGGVISLLLGSMMLIRSESALEFLQISWSVIISVVALTVVFFTFVIGYGIRSLRTRPVSGAEGMVGESGEAVTDIPSAGSKTATGTVRIHGELWNARASGEAIPLGSRVKVLRLENLTLIVERDPH
ncbi:MAG: serine protease [Bacteroidia bacterium]|nr:MAG: serine protease [Bacteroidia bacterium]